MKHLPNQNANASLACKRCRVAGRVQGVSFRAYARERALGLGLSGYARNLADGSVEVLACGQGDAVDALCRWLWRGSPASQVRSVQVEDAAPDDCPEGFSTA